MRDFTDDYCRNLTEIKGWKRGEGSWTRKDSISDFGYQNDPEVHKKKKGLRQKLCIMFKSLYTSRR